MLQCVAMCCSVLQCAAVCCSVLQCVAVCCSVLQCVAVRCSLLRALNTIFQWHSRSVGRYIDRYVAVCCICSVLQFAAVCCSVAVCCSTCTAHTRMLLMYTCTFIRKQTSYTYITYIYIHVHMYVYRILPHVSIKTLFCLHLTPFFALYHRPVPCGSALQCVVACCSVLQCVAACCSARKKLQGKGMQCRTLHY